MLFIIVGTPLSLVWLLFSWLRSKNGKKSPLILDVLALTLVTEFFAWAAYSYSPAHGGFMSCADACSYTPFPWGLWEVLMNFSLITALTIGVPVFAVVGLIYSILSFFRNRKDKIR